MAAGAAAAREVGVDG